MSEHTETAEIITTNSGAIQSFSDTLMADVTEQGYYATFKIETMEDKKILYAARNDNELLRDHMGEVIEVAQFVIDTQKINDAEFGSKTVPCLHIIATDGTCYQSASSGVVESACKIISTFGMPDTWDEPINVACKETTTNNGFRYKFLQVLQ